MTARRLFAALALAAVLGPLDAQNKPDRLERFRDLGFGLFIHWNVDVPLGSVISHSLVGASPDYVQRYFQILPRIFNPYKFNPTDWAILAKLAGMKYVVFTTKHHAGFCMWDTASTAFNVMNTPFGKDITAAVVKAFREQGIAVGFYISPDDFHWFHTHGYPIARPPAPRTTTREIPALMEYGKAQVRELLTRYGPIDVLFIDGPADGLREQAWASQPDIVVTRGAIETPEQHVPGVPMDQAWEACITMGTAWQHKPTHDVYKSGPELIETLIEIRAKGGNLLLNVGPRPDGELSREEEARLREIALWNFANGESLEAVRPWIITNESGIWFTRRKNEPTVYAFVTRAPWKLGERRTLTLRSVRAAPDSKISILGATGEILEYRPDVDPRLIWKQDEKGLHITATTTQRFYDDRKWPNPVVFKITQAGPALRPPQVLTRAARWDGGWLLEGELAQLGDAPSVEVGFQYRPRKGLTDMYEKTEPWRDLAFAKQSAAGRFSQRLPVAARDADLEFRAVVKHPLLTLYGVEKGLTAKD